MTKNLRIETGDRHDPKVEKMNGQVDKRWGKVIILLRMGL
jgi:hypothetical protein